MGRKIKIKNKILIIPGFLLIIASFLANLFLYQKLQTVEASNVVKKVLDGDTLILSWGQRVRLRDVDAPEINFCGGQQAKEELEKLTLGKRITLEDNFSDKMGRIISFVYVGKTFVNEELVKQGWLRFDGHKSSKGGALKAAYQLAREEKRGVFSPLCQQEKNLDNPECIIKGNIDKNSGVKTYHFPGCSGYSRAIVEKDLGDQWFCTEKEAQEAGFKKAKTCYGKSFEK